MAVEILNWFEIPVVDMPRARKFYEAILNVTLVDMDVDGATYPCIPNKGNDGFSGALVQYDFTSPGRQGVLVYFASDDIAASLEKINAAGGKIVHGREEIAPGFGYSAIFEDTEGNMLALQGDK